MNCWHLMVIVELKIYLAFASSCYNTLNFMFVGNILKLIIYETRPLSLLHAVGWVNLDSLSNEELESS